MVDEDQFLESTETAGDVTLATGINWSALVKSFAGSLIATWFLALSGLVESLTSIWVLAIGGISGWVATVIETVVGVPSSFLETASTTSLGAILGLPPVLMFPVGVGVVLGGLWIAARGVEVFRS